MMRQKQESKEMARREAEAKCIGCVLVVVCQSNAGQARDHEFVFLCYDYMIIIV